MKFKELAELYSALESTSKSLEKTSLISDFLKKIGEEDAENIMLLLEGRVFPRGSDKEVGVAESMVIKLLKTVSGISEDEVRKTWNKTGDLGLTAEKVFANKKQATLKSKELTVREVVKSIQSCATITGSNTVSRKVSALSEALSQATPIEAKYFTRIVLNALRVGVAFGILRDALSQAFNADKEVVQEKYDLTNDLGEIALTLIKQGQAGLMKVSMKTGYPFRVMLYNKVDSVAEGFAEVGTPSAIEFKYDGMRVQVHKKGQEVKLFTRRLDNVTKQFPDIVSAVLKFVKTSECILDAEAVAYHPKTGKYLPFQELSRRIKRKYDITELIKRIPVILFVFDVISSEGENATSKPLSERRKIIERIITQRKGVIECAEQLITSSEKEAEKFYAKALRLGEEGVMMKKIDAPYSSGRKTGYGVKVKPIMETLDLAISGGVWGEGKRGAWLSSYYLSCKNEDEYLEVGKMGSGFSEEQFAQITEKLKKMVVKEDGRKVQVKPEIIVEVGYEEVQKSPTYNSGYALRFPRLIRIREDKGEPDELSKVKQIYESQKKR